MSDTEELIGGFEQVLDGLPKEKHDRAVAKLQASLERRVQAIAHGETVILDLQAASKFSKSADEQLPTSGDDCRPNNYYRIKRVIGRGGMGVVYEAEDPESHRAVALKVLKKDAFDLNNDADFTDDKKKNLISRFYREQAITAELDHPNFPRLYTIGIANIDGKSLPFYTMQLIKGETLDDLIIARSTPGATGERLRSEYTITRLLQFAQQICSALQSAHDKQILHRDLKPSNIIIGPYSELYVMDLGLAKYFHDKTPTSRFETKIEEMKRRKDRDLTMDSAVGTPDYMAPEQFLTPQKVDHRSDIFGIGCILYTMITGKRPEYEEPDIRPERLEKRKREIQKTLRNKYASKFGTLTNIFSTPRDELPSDAQRLVDEHETCNGLIQNPRNRYFRLAQEKRECKVVPPSEVVEEQRKARAKSMGFLPMPEPVDSTLDAICLKAMARNPDDRYQSCKEMMQELQNYIEGRKGVILRRRARELAAQMSRQNIDEALKLLDQVESETREAISEQEKMQRSALEEKVELLGVLRDQTRFYNQRGDSESIIKKATQAEPLIEEVMKIVQGEQIKVQTTIGVAKVNLKQYEEAKSKQLEALNLCKRLMVSIYHNYGFACYYAFTKDHNYDDFQKGRKALSECYEIADQLCDKSSAVHARTQLGSLLMSVPEHVQEAKPILDDALAVSLGNDALLAETCTILGTYYFKRGEYQEAVAHETKAIEFANKADMQHYLNEARLILGQAYHFLGDASKRRENLKAAMSCNYPREPPFAEEIIAFYEKNKLDIREVQSKGL